MLLISVPLQISAHLLISAPKKTNNNISQMPKAKGKSFLYLKHAQKAFLPL